jgi:hypothetical protein
MNGLLDAKVSLDDGSKLSFVRTNNALVIQHWRPTAENGAGWLLTASALLAEDMRGALLDVLTVPILRSQPRQKQGARQLKPMPTKPAIALEPEAK